MHCDLNDTHDADLVSLAMHLCEVAVRLLNLRTRDVGMPLEAANDNLPIAPMPASSPPEDSMTLKEILMELRLKEKQVDSLCRLWGFPQPWHEGGLKTFSRRAVMRWARAQPNQNNLAAVLRLRRRDSLRVALLEEPNRL